MVKQTHSCTTDLYTVGMKVLGQLFVGENPVGLAEGQKKQARSI